MNPAPGAPNYPIASLCVSGLAADVTEAMLFEKFSTVGVLSIRVCRDIVTRRSLGYAYVNFQQPAAAEKALETMNFDLIIRGRPCRITWSQRDPSLRKSGVGNIFIKNLDKRIDKKTLYDTFSAFGNILSCKIAQDKEGNSKGYGFVHFDTEKAAENAVRKVNGMLLNDKEVFVTKWMSQGEHLEQLGNQPKKFTNVYVKNFGEEMTETDFRELVEPFGKVLSLTLATSDQGCSKGFGFVSFETPEEAQKAVEELSGKDWKGQKLYAARAQKRAEKQMDLKSQFEKRKVKHINRYQGVNLYVKNLDDTIDDAHLCEEFSAYGTITSAKVMMGDKNNSQAQRSLKMNPAPGAPNYPIACLCISDLAADVTEAMLFEKFSTVGAVLSIRVCRDIVTRRSLGYAYVNFQQPAAAERALHKMNFDLIKGRPCRITWSQRDPSLRKPGVGNIFIKNLDKSIDNKALYDTFSSFGNILSCKIAQDKEGNSKGYGFVHFDTEEAAENAIRKVNGMLLNDKKVFAIKWLSRRERLEQLGNQPKKFTSVYVKNFGEEMTEADLRELVDSFGKVLSLKVVTSDQGRSKGFGFVSFETPEEAQKAVEELSGKDWNGQKLYAARAQKRAERQMDLKSQFEKRKIERINRYQGINLYVKNLDDTIDDACLHEEFSAYGTIISAKVMMDDKNNSKGYGFVCFSSPEEATKAVTEMNGRILMSKPLYVALAQRKEGRKAQLAAQHMQRIAGLRMQQAAGQQVGQVFPQAGAFYMQPLAQAGQRPFFTPQMQQVRPRWQPMHSQQQVQPPGMQGMPGAGQVSCARGIRQVPPRGVPGQQQPGGAGGASQRVGGMGQAQLRGFGAMQAQGQRPAFKFQQNVRNQPAKRHPWAVPMQPQKQVSQTIHIPGQDPLNPSVLAAASLQDQKQMLGERLFPMIQAMHPDQAGRITGMLLEIDNTELLHMLESREALAAKTQEAVSVLRAHIAKKRVQR